MKRHLRYALLLITLSVPLFQGCKSEEKHQVVRIAVPQFLTSSLIFIAKDQNYFADEGIDLELDVLQYGKDCLKKMLLNEYDLSAVFISPLAKSIMDNQDVTVLTELHSSGNNTKLLFRKDLVSPPFSGSKIGLIKDTNAEFLMALFSAVNSIPPESFTIVNQDVEVLESQLLEGVIQGAVFWQPRVDRLLTKYPTKITSAETPFYTDFSALVGNTKFVNENKESMYKIIKALVKAKKLLDNEPAKAYEIALKYTLDKSIENHQEGFKNLSIELGLSQMFKVMLSSEINWNKKLFSKQRLGHKEHLNFRTEFLKAYLPEKVTIQ